MRYRANPFYILNVSMRDSQDVILDKVEDLSLTMDEARCSQAASILINPTKRIEAEVSWFPGYTKKKIDEAFENAKSDPVMFIEKLSKNRLSYADVNAEILAFLHIAYPPILKDYLLKIASDLERLDAHVLLAELNKERSVAGIPAIPNIDILNDALQKRNKELTEIFYSFLKDFSQQNLIDILTSAIEENTDNGNLEASQLLLHLIEKYEMDIQSSLKDAADKVQQQIAYISHGVDRSISDDELESAIDSLGTLLKAWDYLAQPIQVSMQSQGLEHSASKDMARSVRRLALNLYNEQKRLEAAKRIIELMKTVFAEVLTVAEKADEDEMILNSIDEREELIRTLVDIAKRICFQYINKAESNPKLGYQVALEMLSSEELNIMNIVYEGLPRGETHLLKDLLPFVFDEYYSIILQCLILYGNATGNWDITKNFSKVLRYALNRENNDKLKEYVSILTSMQSSSNFSKNNPFSKTRDVSAGVQKTTKKALKFLGVIAAVILLFVFWGNHGKSPRSSTNANRQHTSQRQPSQRKPTQRQTSSTKPQTEKPPIPRRNVITGYDNDHPYLNDEGLCEITIDNTKNNMPVYVRIWDVQERTPVRAFFISEGEDFTATELTPGKYEVRYRELYENDASPYGSKSETFSLKQRRTPTGEEYSTISLTLYKVRNGNARTERIDANDI